ncbi:MAG: hypothetical protein FJ144_26715 [Deltaproteobacteria bacterium]|nr:hypothetical protein [Deltaproteobacteria bacterium]
MSAITRAAVSLAVILLSALATLWAASLQPPPPPPPRDQVEPLFSFPPEEVNEISVRTWQGRLEAVRREDRLWTVRRLELRESGDASEPVATPAPAAVDEEVQALVAGLVRLPVVGRFPREDRPLSGFGLEEPQAEASLVLASGERREIRFGDRTATGAGLYAQAPPADEILQVGSLILNEIGASFYRLRAFATPSAASP